MATTALDNATLIERYLDVCNDALAAHENEFPYRHIIKTADRVLTDRPIHVAVYDRDPQDVEDRFTVVLDHTRLKTLDHRSGGDGQDHWRVKRRYLEQVVENPESYVRNPVKLDWDWLRYRLGLE